MCRLTMPIKSWSRNTSPKEADQLYWIYPSIADPLHWAKHMTLAVLTVHLARQTGPQEEMGKAGTIQCGNVVLGLGPPIS